MSQNEIVDMGGDTQLTIKSGNSSSSWAECITIRCFQPDNTNTHKLNIGGYKIEIPILSEYLKYSITGESLVTIFMYDMIVKLQAENKALADRIAVLEDLVD
jgi:hypothetical protein